MNTTSIEYGTHHWPIITGCAQPHSTCAIRETCWARGLHKRFGKQWAKLYNPDFSLRFNESLLNAPFSLRKPARILVAFTGDMFGPGSEHYWSAQERVLGRVWSLPQHQFLFLTKSPENLARLNPWPDNAWVGVSITGAETPSHQLALIRGLVLKVKAGIKWVSYEPVLGPLQIPLVGIKWLVIGAQTGLGAMLPKREWVMEIVETADKAGIPTFIKNNLKAQWGQIVRQEYPVIKKEGG